MPGVTRKNPKNKNLVSILRQIRLAKRRGMSVKKLERSVMGKSFKRVAVPVNKSKKSKTASKASKVTLPSRRSQRGAPPPGAMTNNANKSHATHLSKTAAANAAYNEEKKAAAARKAAKAAKAALGAELPGIPEAEEIKASDYEKLKEELKGCVVKKYSKSPFKRGVFLDFIDTIKAPLNAENL